MPLPDSPHFQVHGDVSGTSIQAGAVHGDVHVHSSAGPHVLHQLPLPAPHFTNRVKELQQITHPAYQPEALRLVVVTGSAGIGKSALAAHAAHALRPAAPHGQLYADLRAFNEDGPADPAEVAAAFLAALGTAPDRIPPDLATRTAWLRSATTGKQMLFLLDDAASAAQVRALLPGPGPHTVVVTTRLNLASLTTHGARFLALEPMADTDATRLLQRLLHARPDQQALVAATARHCAGLPIAVTAAAVGITLRGTDALESTAADLAQHHHRLSILSTDADEVSVRAAFTTSYAALPAPAAQLYRRCGWLPGRELTRPVAAALLGTTSEQASAALRTLATANLVQEHTPGRYRMHDLIHLHARERAEAEEADQHAAVLDRVLTHYAEHVRAADAVLRPYVTRYRMSPGPALFADEPQALEWLQRERGVLVHLAEHAAQHHHIEHAAAIADGTWPLFLRTRNAASCQHAHDSAARAARAAGEHTVLARLLGRLGLVLSYQGHDDQAHDVLAEAEQIWQEEGNAHRLAQVVQRRGAIDVYRRHDTTALEYLQRALHLADPRTSPHDTAITLLHLGRLHNRLHRFDEAERDLRRALELLQDPPDAANTARVHIALAHVLAHRAPDQARTHLRTAAGEHSGSLLVRAEAQEALAELERAAGRTGRALEHYDHALHLFTETADHASHQRITEATAALRANP